MRNLLVIAALIASAAVGPAQAADLTRAAYGYVYFHKPAASLAQHDSDLLDCYDKARQFYQPAERYTAGQQEGILEVLIGDTVALNTAKPRGYPANLENCMVAKGWSVVLLPGERGAALTALPVLELRRQLYGMVGRMPVEGRVIRVFGNEAMLAGTTMFEAGRLQTPPSLSVVGQDNWKAAGRIEPWPNSYERRGGARLVALDKVKAPTDGRSVIIIRFKRGGATLRALKFRRIVNAYAESPFKGTDQFGLFMPPGSAKAEEPEYVTLTLTVLPGWWALTGIQSTDYVGSYAYGMHFCLGAPAFDVKPGAIVFAGTFDGGGSTYVPDMSLDGLKAELTEVQPALIEAVKPAAWVNGAAGDCYGFGYLYALEFPGAPFFEGYPYGSAAAPRDALPAS